MNTPEKRNKLPSAMQLHALFTYDPSTGFLWWKERPVSEFKNAHFTFEEAVAARKAFEVQYGYHPNHGRAA